ncbi:MAG TPA: glycoside hydrolase family 2 TIM barrel-domain containing protein, partial [Cytophagaceae bacterium]|nr:glycoside hydrolase family 2 TIM barrel-domain containing protein [Cytophagaceae bacterium]
MKKHLITSLLLPLYFILSFSQFVNASETIVKKVEGQWKLYADGKPFTLKGVTFGKPITKENIGAYMKDLKFLGVNTIRTWGTGKETLLLLDSANAYGIKVLLGIWMRHGRPGMEGDDSFDYINDKKGKEAMFNDAIQAVKLYKNHPGLLMWGVGNEVTLNIATDPEKKVYAQYLETVLLAIKAEDPKHVVASVSAWTFDWKWWKEYTPSLDVYGINVYGGGANQIPDELAKLGVDKPYMICEYGVNGEWEAKPDKNGLLVEPNDRQKYDVIAKGYKDWIASKSNCLGVYIFHYGNGADHGAVWLNMYFDNYYRPAYWATREAYTGKKPIHPIPD